MLTGKARVNRALAKNRKKTLTKEVKQLKKTVRQNMPELKFFDTSQAAVNFSLAGAHINLLSAIAQGDTMNNREGSQVTIKSIQLKYRLNINLDGVPPNYSYGTVCRVSVIKQKVYLAGSPYPTIGEMFSAGTAVEPAVYLKNLSNSRLFKTLYDKVHILSQGEKFDVFDEFYMKKLIKLKWETSGANSVADRLFIVVQTSDNAGTLPAITYQCRLRFIDN